MANAVPLSLLLVLLLVLLLLGLAGTRLAAVRADQHLSGPPSGRLAAVARTTGRWKAGGLLVGLGVAGVSLEHGALGRGVLLAAPLFGICVLLGVVAGELRVDAPGGVTRTATLEVRRMRDYLPRGLAVAVGSATGVLVLVLAATTAAGSPDDLGRAGRSLARYCGSQLCGRTGPWPGSFYSLPLVAVVLVGLLVAAVAVQRVVRRPRQGQEPHLDDALRRRATTSVMAAVGVLVSVPLVGVSAISARALLGSGDRIFAGWALALLAPLALALGAWCAGVLAMPPRTDTTTPARR